MVTKNVSRAPPCFGEHVNLLVPAAFAVGGTHSIRKDDVRRAGRSYKVFSKSLSKHVVPTPLKVIRAAEGRRIG
jgi:hypothetical protein